jgi:hypothetical protein
VTILDYAAPGDTASSPIVGSTEPRVWTPPLRELTADTSYGFDVIDFAEEIGHPLLPWQEFAVIHGGELLPDGRPRFRILLLVVGRQNGKTELPVVLSVYWQFRQKVPLILGTSTKLNYAKESWLKAVNLVRRTPSLHGLHEPGRKWFRMTNGETESWTHHGDRYLIAASNSEGGRSLTIDRGIADELRQHRTYEAWDAFEPACSPPDAQIWALSNAGDSRSVVLNDLQDSAQDFIETGDGDPRLGLLEWSAPPDADPEDVGALLQANPRMGYGGQDLESLLTAARRAKRTGGAALNGFKTERMCIRVKVLRPAVSGPAWKKTLDPGPLEPGRRRIALCIDLSSDGAHATLAAAQVTADGRVRVELLHAWTGATAASDAERELPSYVRRIRPSVLGWFPRGPAAAVAATLQGPIRGTRIEAIRGDEPAVVMGFAKEVAAATLARSDDPLLEDHVTGAERMASSGGWVFARSDGAHVDAAYAAAGAVHLARTLPPVREYVRRVRSAPTG